MNKRILKQKIFISLCIVSALITASFLILIVGLIFLKGSSSLTLSYILTTEHDASGWNAGILNAIAGTIILATMSVTIATPMALSVAVYMTEYSRENLFIKTLRFLIDLLAGMPSIVLGMLGFMILVVSLKYFTGGFSLIAGAIALSILVMPTIERAAEEAIKTVPNELKEGGFALGSTKFECIKSIVIPSAMPGIITGVVLGIGRAAEESAVVVLTAGYTQFMPRLGVFPKEEIFMHMKIAPFQEGIATLPIAVYHSFEFSNLVPIENGFATATVIIVIVMGINLMARFIGKRYGAK